ncbi:hypothetical protein GGF31_006274 [Allomyces arbusculus]|nr:hypothetical protein GGF31_006274 [Allomyces arbusculus]
MRLYMNALRERVNVLRDKAAHKHIDMLIEHMEELHNHVDALIEEDVRNRVETPAGEVDALMEEGSREQVDEAIKEAKRNRIGALVEEGEWNHSNKAVEEAERDHVVEYGQRVMDTSFRGWVDVLTKNPFPVEGPAFNPRLR